MKNNFDNVKVFENSKKIKLFDKKYISPINATIYENINKTYANDGIILSKNNKIALLILVGGNASRFSQNKPKSIYEFNYQNENKSLLSIMFEKINDNYIKTKNASELYLMVNRDNYENITTYLKNNNYFNYPKNKIKLLIQNELPILDTNGNILKNNSDITITGPCGNGDAIHVLDENNLFRHFSKNRIKYLIVLGIDNINVNLFDYKLIGYMDNEDIHALSKSIIKEDKEWVFAKYKEKTVILDNFNIENIKLNNDKHYIDRNICYHIFNISELNKIKKRKVPLHRAYKYTKMSDNDIDNKPNSFKFEYFIYDYLKYIKRNSVVRVSKDEFYPIKNMKDLENLSK